MKWKPKPRPKDGDRRQRLEFAWLPMFCVDGYYRWLCHVIVERMYVDMPLGGISKWHTLQAWGYWEWCATEGSTPEPRYVELEACPAPDGDGHQFENGRCIYCPATGGES